MSRVFMGDASRVDPEVLQKAKALPDEFDVLFEFSKPGRNVDLFIVKHMPNGSEALIVTEVKRIAKQVRGEIDSAWQSLNRETNQWEDIIPSNRDDSNWYWQLVNTVTVVKQWLRTNQNLFLEHVRPVPLEESDFRVWPDLLILSPTGVYHRLPLRPTTGFGAWWTDLDRWVQHLLAWVPNSPIALDRAEVTTLVNLMGLKQVWPTTPVEQAPRPEVTLAQAVQALTAFLQGLDDRVKRLEEVTRR